MDVLLKQVYGSVNGSTMMKHYIFVSIYLMSLLVVTQTNSQDISVPIHESVTFSCPVSNIVTTTWTFLKRGQHSGGSIIVQGNNPYHENEHNVTTTTINSTTVLIKLEVLKADEDDEGTYSCQEAGEEKAEGRLTVEIAPVLTLMKAEVMVNDTIDVVFTKEVPIQCVAEGGKPSVALSWEINGQERTIVVTIDLSQENERIITSTLHYIPNREDKTLTCTTSGQEVIPDKSVTISVNVMYAPSCNLVVTNDTSTNQFRLTCTCDSNPSVNNYTILVNGSIYREEKEVFLPSTDTAVVSCTASNVIGTYTTEKEKLDPFHVDQPSSPTNAVLIVALCIIIPASIVVVLVILIKFIRYRRKALNEKTTAEETATFKIKKLSNTITTMKATNIPLPSEDDEKYEKNDKQEIPLLDSVREKSEKNLMSSEDT